MKLFILLGLSTVRFDPKATLEAFELPDIPYTDAPEPPVVMPPADLSGPLRG